MKKIFCSLALIAAVCAVLFVSCKKDSDVVTLKCHVENAGVFGKGYIDDNDYPRFFSEGEQVNVNGNSYSIVPASNWAFDIVDVPTPEANQEVTYYAVYPNSITTSVCNSTSVDVNLPFTQTYRLNGSNQIVDLPMGAVATNRNSVQFYNLCSVLELTITNSTGAAFAVSSIEVKLEGAGLAGKGIASLAGASSKIEIPAVNPTTNVDNTRIVVDLPTPIQVANNSSSAPIKVVLPPFTNKQLSIKVRTDNGAKSVVKRNASFTLERNTIYPLNYVISQLQEKPDNELSGYFSVSPTKKVVFSKGNLQAYRVNASDSWSWKFADHQYDFYGKNNFDPATSSYVADVHQLHRDLFLLSTNDENSEYGLNFDIDESDRGSAFVDWGGNHIEGDLPANATNVWYTLSLNEWHYLIGDVGTNSSSPARPNAANLRARAKITMPTINYTHPASYTGSDNQERNITTVYGFLILPDNWTTPYDVQMNPSNMNEYDYETWTRLEAAGAMFLPAFGTVNVEFDNDGDNSGDVEVFTQTHSEYNDGYYWSSTPVFRSDAVEGNYLYYNYNSNYSIGWHFGNDQYKSFNDAMFVRLVKDAPISTTTGTK